MSYIFLVTTFLWQQFRILLSSNKIYTYIYNRTSAPPKCKNKLSPFKQVSIEIYDGAFSGHQISSGICVKFVGEEIGVATLNKLTP